MLYEIGCKLLLLFQVLCSAPVASAAISMAAAKTSSCAQGYIYIEAFKESHVKEAIQGLRCIYSSKGAKLVPMKEVVDAITVNRKAKASMGPQLSLQRTLKALRHTPEVAA